MSLLLISFTVFLSYMATFSLTGSHGNDFGFSCYVNEARSRIRKTQNETKKWKETGKCYSTGINRRCCYVYFFSCQRYKKLHRKTVHYATPQKSKSRRNNKQDQFNSSGKREEKIFFFSRETGRLLAVLIFYLHTHFRWEWIWIGDVRNTSHFLENETEQDPSRILDRLITLPLSQ